MGSHIALCREMYDHLKWGPEKSLFEGLSSPSPYTPPAKRELKHPYPIHMNARQGGESEKG